MQQSKLAFRRVGRSPALAACSVALLWSVGCGSDEAPGLCAQEPCVGPQFPVQGDGNAAGDGAGDSDGDGAADGSSTADGDDGQQPPITVQSAWCDTLGVLRTSCQECHSRNVESTAPMPLDTYEDLLATSVLDSSKKVYEVVGERIHDERRPMPEPPRTLSDADKAIIDAWIAGGAQPGPDPTCTTAVQPGDGDEGGDGAGDGNIYPEEQWPEDCEEFYTITVGNGQGHTVPANTEEHPQFYFDAPWGNDPVQALAFKPITDNKRVIHHWILYENGGSASGVGGNFLTGWAPGKDNLRTFPDDIGVYLPSGSDALRLDTHYYNLGNSQAEPDNSGVEICITRNFREHTAGTHAFGTLLFSVPASGVKDVKPVCSVTTTGGSAYLLASSPHMHKRGIWAQLMLTQNGVDKMLHDETFSFEFQDAKALNRVELKSGDTVMTNCRFEGNGVRAGFGQDSDDEMCFNFALYYPRGALSCRNTNEGAFLF